ncbi:MAG: type III-A CRISPR-associated RAMP protein Csm4 [Chloroflexi bacterium]|nr:MAG: type III-A CRISPR-associated RAMP protein Csm4 [Chloroflexota bacterium]
MADLTVYRFTFRGGLHVGERGVNLEEHSVQVSSGTLFAALVAVWRRMGHDPAAFGTPFLQRQPPFLLTSLFPFAGDVRFFPLPVPLLRWFSPATLQHRRKDLGKVRFVSEKILRKLLAGEPLDEWLFPESTTAESAKGVALQGGVFWLTAAEIQKLPSELRRRQGKYHALRCLKIYGVDKAPRVTIDRLTSASDLFHVGRVRFTPGCGLWFGVDWRAPERVVGDSGLTYRAAFDRVLILLGEDGLGGERSTGYGAFKFVSEGALSLPDPEPGAPLLLLSRYHPRKAELPDALTGPQAAYTLIPKGGWVQTWDGAARRRKRLWLLAEGSVAQAVDAGPWGDVVNVQPDGFPHPVWRYGFALGAALTGGER